MSQDYLTFPVMVNYDKTKSVGTLTLHKDIASDPKSLSQMILAPGYQIDTETKKAIKVHEFGIFEGSKYRHNPDIEKDLEQNPRRGNMEVVRFKKISTTVDPALKEPFIAALDEKGRIWIYSPRATKGTFVQISSPTEKKCTQ